MQVSGTKLYSLYQQFGQEIKKETRVKIMHNSTNKFLHSSLLRYQGGSKQQQVDLIEDLHDQETWWIVKWEEGFTKFRFTHQMTGANLHTHAKHKSPSEKFGEVTIFGNGGVGDDNDYWELELDDQQNKQLQLDNVFREASVFRLRHVKLGTYLHSCPGLLTQDNKQEVSTNEVRNDMNTWSVVVNEMVLPITLSHFGQEIKFEQQIIIRHFHTGKFLHSHNTNHTSGSKQQEVTCYESSDDKNNVWIIRGDVPFEDDSIIRLTHLITTANLHSNPKFKSNSSKQGEVSCFGRLGEGNDDDFWILKISRRENSQYKLGLEHFLDQFIRIHIIHYIRTLAIRAATPNNRRLQPLKEAMKMTYGIFINDITHKIYVIIDKQKSL